MSAEPAVLVYFKPGCPFAARLRLGLTLARVPHRSQSFRRDEDAAARVRAANGGNEVSPTVLVRGLRARAPAHGRRTREITTVAEGSVGGEQLTGPITSGRSTA